MTQLDPRIILGIQQPDFVNTLARSNQAAAGANALRDQNAMRELYKTQGPGIAAGDPAALNALAQFDPAASLGIRAQHEQMDQRRQQAKRVASEYAATLNARQAEKEARELETAIKRGIGFFQSGDLDGLNRMLVEIGEQPLDSVEQFPAVASIYGDALEALSDVTKLSVGPEPADEYQRYVQEETAAGRKPLDRIQYAQAKKGKGFSVELPDGTRVQMGGGAEVTGVQPSSPEAMVATIDGILNDPALDKSTGILSPLQSIPGTPQRRFAGRARQLEGQAFLQAFESLKGGGQITEIEGQKATQAIGRLDTAQSADDYRAALTELRDVLVKAQQRPVGWAYNQPDPSLSQGNAPEVGVTEDGYRFLGGDPGDASNWEKVK